ncbi:hypothetical protein JTE90_004216, partial [Oedothorax gibbosus]
MATVDGATVDGGSRLRGRIELIFGPMFSGKTTELIRRLRRYMLAKHDCLIVKYASDAKHEIDHITTHDSQCQAALLATTLHDLKSLASIYSVIAIDEGHFFPDIVSFAEEMAQRDKVILIAALDGTSERKPFGHVLQLMPLAENVIKLTAICMHCFRDAAFTTSIETDDTTGRKHIY